VDHFVIIDRLPADFAIPAELGDRLRYDERSGRLSFRGFMSKAEFDHICGLTRDWPFKRKLEILFNSCTYGDSSPSSRPAWGLSFLFGRRAVPS